MSRQIGISIEGVPDPSTVTVELIPDLFPTLFGVVEPGTGHFLFDVPDSYEGGFHVRASAPGYETALRRVVDANGNDQPIQTAPSELIPPMVLEPINVPEPLPWLQRLVAARQHLRLSDGTRWTGIQATDFHLLGRVCNGEDVSEVLAQRSSLGFNLLRLFTAYDIPNTIGVCKPKDHPDYTDNLLALMQRCNDVGLYVELVGFTGNQTTHYGSLFANDAEKIDHWERLIDVADACPNVILELVNEYNVNANKDLPFDDLRRPPTHIMAAHGSGGLADLALDAALGLCDVPYE